MLFSATTIDVSGFFRIAAVVGLAAMPTQAVEVYVGVGPICSPIFEDSAEYKKQAAAYANFATGPAELVRDCKLGVASKVYASLIGPDASHDDAFVACMEWEPANFGHADAGNFCKDALLRLFAAADQADDDTALTNCGALAGPAIIAVCKIVIYESFRARLSLPNKAGVDLRLGTFSHVEFKRVDAAICHSDIGEPWATSENIKIGSAMQPAVEWYIASRSQARIRKFEACNTVKLGSVAASYVRLTDAEKANTRAQCAGVLARV